MRKTIESVEHGRTHTAAPHAKLVRDPETVGGLLLKIVIGNDEPKVFCVGDQRQPSMKFTRIEP